jgi:hypothetical protein
MARNDLDQSGGRHAAIPWRWMKVAIDQARLIDGLSTG